MRLPALAGHRTAGLSIAGFELRVGLFSRSFESPSALQQERAPPRRGGGTMAATDNFWQPAAHSVSHYRHP